MSEPHRTYYDHEPAYREIQAAGGRGWDDRKPGVDNKSYLGLDAFLAGPHCPPPGAALELGCGGGQAALRLVALGFRVTGVDFSETAIALAQRNAVDAGVEATFVVGDCLRLAGFDDAAFDLVVDNHALHCIVGSADRRRFLLSAARVLKVGGTLFTESMTAEGDFRPEEREIDPTTRISHTGRRYWVRRAELHQELREVGFRIEHELAQDHEDGYGDTLAVVATRMA